MSKTKKHHLIHDSVSNFVHNRHIDNMFKKELASIVTGESIEVIFIDEDQNSLPHSSCVYGATERDLLG